MLKRLMLVSFSALALAAGAPLDLRSHRLRTLPAEAYPLLVKGTGWGAFSWSWKAPSFKPGAGYAVEETRWDWEDRQGAVLKELRKQLELQARAGSPNRLSLRVVYFAVDSVGPQLLLEGSFREEGQQKACFVESVILQPGDPLGDLVEEFMRDFTAFLR